MPAAAVIPAPIAYTFVVAVEKLVAGSWARLAGLPALSGVNRSGRGAKADAAPLQLSLLCDEPAAALCWAVDSPGLRTVYFEKIRVFKAGLRHEWY